MCFIILLFLVCVCVTSSWLQGEFEPSVDQCSYLDVHQSFAMFIQLPKRPLPSCSNSSNYHEELNMSVYTQTESNVSDNRVSHFSVKCIKIHVNMELTWIDPHGSRLCSDGLETVCVTFMGVFTPHCTLQLVCGIYAHFDAEHCCYWCIDH